MGFWHSFDTVLVQFAPRTGQFARACRGAVHGSGLESVEQLCRGVAQPGSAPALGAGGPRFKSARPDHCGVGFEERAHRDRGYSAGVITHSLAGNADVANGLN